jgi:hypothetical protein
MKIDNVYITNLVKLTQVRTTIWQVSPNCKHLTVQSTARHAIHLQFDIIANALEIRAVQSPKCVV